MSHERYEEGESRRLVEGVLATWQPAKLQLDRDRLMFLAGRASAVGGGGGAGVRVRALTPALQPSWLWPAATAVFAAASVLLAIALVNRTEATVAMREQVVPSAVMVDVATAPAEPRAIAVGNLPGDHATDGPGSASGLVTSSSVFRARTTPVSYIQTRDVALRMGVDALGSATGPSNSLAAPSYFQLMQGVSPAGTSGGAAPVSKPLHSM